MLEKQNLVIICTGGKPVFEKWPTDYNNYNYDVAVIQWSQVELSNVAGARYHYYDVGQKWHLIARFAQKHDISQYHRIACFDDDVFTTPEMLAKLFDFAEQENLDLAQPALTPNSFFGYNENLQIPGARMHITDTVEVMCPIFSQAAWQEISTIFADLPVGVGMELENWFKYCLESYNGTTKFGGRVAVIDCLPVTHTKWFTQWDEYQARDLDPGLDALYIKTHRDLGPRHDCHSFNTIEVIYSDYQQYRIGPLTR